MDATHLHLLLNHFPIVGTLIAIVLLGYGIFSDNIHLKKAAALLLICLSLITIVVFQTGEGAEETVEEIAGVSHRQIHEHEEGAELAVWLMYALGALALVCYGMMKAKMVPSKILCYITLALGIFTLVTMVKVGNEGGKIRHAQELGVVTPGTNNHHDD